MGSCGARFLVSVLLLFCPFCVDYTESGVQGIRLFFQKLENGEKAEKSRPNILHKNGGVKGDLLK